MGVPGELNFVWDMSLKIGTVPETLGWMVTLGIAVLMLGISVKLLYVEPS